MEPESYYAIFWKRWLPAVGHPEARRASEKLAGEMASRHGDTSVRDALGAYTPRASAALTQLAQVLGDVRAGKSDSAWPVAKLVLSDLERQGQRAAALRLRGEMIYMDRVQSRLGDCLGDGEAALAALRGVSYPWLAGKFRLEHAICLMEAGDSSGARAEIASASHDAEAHRLESIHIRALGFLVSSDSVSGNHEAVWQNAPAGLAEYWTSSTSHYAAQQLESDLEQSAAALGWDDAAAAIYDEVIRSASRAGNLGMEAVDRMDRAVLLKAIGDNAGENREIDAADRLFGKLPPGPEINMRLWFGRLRRAESEIDSGRAAQALPLLDALAATSGVRREADQISLDQDRGLAYYALSNWPAAASGFQQAIARNEKAPSPSPAALDSYRGLTQIQLIRNQAPAAFATWQASRVAFPSGHSSPVSAHPVIAFALLPQGVAVFRKTGETWRARMVQASTDEMERTARRFVRLCSSPSSNLGELRATGNQLYRWLLQPELAGLRDGSRVLLQTDGWIAGVPFDALTTDSGTYLGAHVITEQLGGRFPPSSADDEGLGAAAPALLVSAPSARAPGGLRLPLLLSASEEIADVRAILPNATLLEDDAATPATLRAAIPRAQIFHFAGHGWSDGGNGALILAPDPAPDSGGAPRYLTSHEISGQDWSHCSLAVLSACLTAAGESRGPVNSQSLVRAILAAGVPRVIAAKWSISSEATRSLMREFYRQLVGGAVPAQALNRAEAMLEHNARWNHPYYWAGFAVFRR
jgi:CHAT domain-containing protein